MHFLRQKEKQMNISNSIILQIQMSCAKLFTLPKSWKLFYMIYFIKYSLYQKLLQIKVEQLNGIYILCCT